jgi:hypothetical protein
MHYLVVVEHNTRIATSSFIMAAAGPGRADPGNWRESAT